jgi:hypothetical protein
MAFENATPNEILTILFRFGNLKIAFVVIASADCTNERRDWKSSAISTFLRHAPNLSALAY